MTLSILNSYHRPLWIAFSVYIWSKFPCEYIHFDLTLIKSILIFHLRIKIFCLLLYNTFKFLLCSSITKLMNCVIICSFVFFFWSFSFIFTLCIVFIYDLFGFAFHLFFSIPFVSFGHCLGYSYLNSFDTCNLNIFFNVY